MGRPNRQRALNAERDPYDDAVDWLVNSCHVESAVVEHFFHLCDQQECACEEEGRV